MPPNDRRTPLYDMELLVNRLEKSIGHIEAGFTHSNFEVMTVKAEISRVTVRLEDIVRRIESASQDVLKNEDKIIKFQSESAALIERLSVVENDVADIIERIKPFDQGNGHSLKTLLYDAGKRLESLEGTRKLVIGLIITVAAGMLLALANQYVFRPMPAPVDTKQLKEDIKTELQQAINDAVNQRSSTLNPKGTPQDVRPIKR